ncbi:hypothetical protein [Haloprofundus salilacus]|uniref:hypothetical protein n=1 Tax=Haloprofundus salilacus TaxID=2876190 RepID=UPI001CCDF2FA|nr:hypothetical protein [Haloprofundus salilacus]
MSSDTESNSWRQRELLFRQAMTDKQSLYTTYNRYYKAHHVTTQAGWIVTALTAIIGAVLLYVITSNTFSLQLFSEYLQGTSDVLAICLLILSLMNAFYSPEARSVRYYRAGQDLQELHDEYENFVNLDLANLDRELEPLREKFDQLHTRRHNLNKSVPQLSGIWYSMTKLSQDGYRTLIPFIPSKNDKSLYHRLKAKYGSDDNENFDQNDSSETKNQWEETLAEKVSGFEPAQKECEVEHSS